MHEHDIENDDGTIFRRVDKSVLEELAANNNRNVLETADPAVIIVGHSSDEPGAPELPVKGFVVNYRVKPYKRDEKTGQTIYAVYGDYKVRPEHKGVLKDYPFRSVEYHTRQNELSAVAKLGSSKSQQNLGATPVYYARGAMDVDSVRLYSRGYKPDPTTVVRYDRRGGGAVYRFSMEDSEMPCPPGMNPKKYAAGEPGDDDMDDDTGVDGTDLYDDGDGADDVQDDGTGAGMDDGADANGVSPMVAEVLASKPIKEMMGKVDEMYAAIVGESGGGGMGAGGPPPGAGPAGPPPGGAPGMDDGMGGPPEEEPVRFESTGFPGPGSATIPGVGAGTMGKRYSRSMNGGTHTNGSAPMTRNGTGAVSRPRPSAPAAVPEVVKLQRQVRDLQLKLSRADAERTIAALEAEGIIFGDKAYDTELLAQLGPAEQKGVIDKIKLNYKRRDNDPTNPGYTGLAQYARGDANQGSSDPDTYAAATPADAAVYADLVTHRKMTPEAAVKYMRSRRRA